MRTNEKALCRCDYCLQPKDTTNSPAHLRQSDGKWTIKTYVMCDECKEYMRGNFKYYQEYLKPNSKKCPIDGGDLHFEQMHGMMMYREITPERPKRAFNVFNARCSQCSNNFQVRR
jgi:hypothetical protein